MKNDFEFLKEVLDSFFQVNSVADGLALIYDTGITDWEKWLQIEFARYCYKHEKITQSEREKRYGLDKRKSKLRNVCAIDFWIKQKHKQSGFGLELKQHFKTRRCISLMLNDKAKVNNVKFSHNDLRSVWFWGVHEAADKSEVNIVVDKLSEIYKVEINPKLLHSSPILNTNFSYTIF